MARSLDHFLAQGVSISAQPKKVMIQVGCTCFTGPVGVRLGAYSNNALCKQEVWPCETDHVRRLQQEHIGWLFVNFGIII